MRFVNKAVFGFCIGVCVLFILIVNQVQKQEEQKPVAEPSYVDWYRGSDNTNVILSVPHDGDLLPHNLIRNRKQGCYDRNTDTCDYHHDCAATGHRKVFGECTAIIVPDYQASKIALEMRKAIASLTGKIPHMIVSRLHRSKMDPNRLREDGTQYNPHAERAYDRFHDHIQIAHDLVAHNGPGIQFDIHGYVTHKADNWTEIGYNIKAIDLNGEMIYKQSSIRALAERISTRTPFSSLLRGEESLGGMFEQAGYRTVPSPRYPSPKDGIEGKYYRGGYITRRWGSLSGGDIDCVQLEFPPWVREGYVEHGLKLGSAMAHFVDLYYSH